MAKAKKVSVETASPWVSVPSRGADETIAAVDAIATAIKAVNALKSFQKKDAEFPGAYLAAVRLKEASMWLNAFSNSQALTFTYRVAFKDKTTKPPRKSKRGRRA